MEFFARPISMRLVRFAHSITQDDVQKLLRGIVRPQSAAHTLEENASELQRRFETIVADDKEMHERACKGEQAFRIYLARVISACVSE